MALRSELHHQQLVAVKEADSVEELRREAQLLESLNHPGVVRFVEFIEDDSGARLLTRYAGRETLATWQPQRLEELRRVAEELAEAVGYLHGKGIVHCDIAPAHVLIDALRRPQLCGFSAARVDAEPTDGADGDSGRSADVTAVGETILGALERLTAAPTRPGARRDDQRLRDRLGSVATAAAEGRVPSAKALAGQLGATAVESSGTLGRQTSAGGPPMPQRPPPVQPPAPIHRHHGRPRRWRLSRTGRLVAATLCGGCAIGTLMVLQLGAGDSSTVRAPTSTAGAAVPSGAEERRAAGSAGGGEAVTPTTAESETAATAHETSPCRPSAPDARDTDGDGCAEEIRIVSGFVAVDGVYYPIGTPEDQIAVGDWDCDGAATVALLQPGGQLYVFDSWPRFEPLVGTLVADLASPVTLTETTRGACHELGVRYAGGTWLLPLPTTRY